MSMEELSSPERQLKVKRKVYCKEFGHEDRALKFYCETCDRLICRYCMDFKHLRPDHVCHVAKTIVHKHRELLAASNENLENQLEKAERFSTQLSFATNRVEMATLDVKSKVVAVKERILQMVSDELERKSKDMMTDIDEIQGEKLVKLKRHTEKTNAHVKDINRCIQRSAKLLQEGTDEEVILTKKTVNDDERKIRGHSLKNFKVPVTEFAVQLVGYNEEKGDVAKLLAKVNAMMGYIYKGKSLQ